MNLMIFVYAKVQATMDPKLFDTSFGYIGTYINPRTIIFTTWYRRIIPLPLNRIANEFYDENLHLIEKKLIL